MKILINERLSEHRCKTPEGYLICTDAILARTGKQTYRKNEIFKDSDDETEIEVDRTEDEVFSPQTLASFENKPVTVEHPDEDVNVHNYKEYAVGFVRDVHRGEVNGQPVILGNLVITDEQTIQEIENGEHTDLSCGYDCDIADEANPCQRNIRGNHVALCECGRAGIARIVDSDVPRGYKVTGNNYAWELSGTAKDKTEAANKFTRKYPELENIWGISELLNFMIRSNKDVERDTELGYALHFDYDEDTKKFYIAFVEKKYRYDDSDTMQINQKKHVCDAQVMTSSEHTYDGRNYYGYMHVEHPRLGDFYISFKIKGRRNEIQLDGTPWNFIKSKGYTSEQKDWIVRHSKELERVQTNATIDDSIVDSKCKDFDDTGKNIRVVKEFIEQNGNKFDKRKDADAILEYIKKRTGIANADYGDVLYIIKEYTRAEITDSVKDARMKVANLTNGYAIVPASRWRKFGLNAEVERFTTNLDEARYIRSSLERNDGISFVIVDVTQRRTADSMKDALIFDAQATVYAVKAKYENVVLEWYVRANSEREAFDKVKRQPGHNFDTFVSAKIVKERAGMHIIDESPVYDALIPPTKEAINKFESLLRIFDINIDRKGLTPLGRVHYQVRANMEFDRFVKRLERIDDEMDKLGIPMTFNAGSDGNACTAGIDLDKQHVKDSQRAQKIQNAKCIQDSKEQLFTVKYKQGDTMYIHKVRASSIEDAISKVKDDDDINKLQQLITETLSARADAWRSDKQKEIRQAKENIANAIGATQNVRRDIKEFYTLPEYVRRTAEKEARSELKQYDYLLNIQNKIYEKYSSLMREAESLAKTIEAKYNVKLNLELNRSGGEREAIRILKTIRNTSRS